MSNVTSQIEELNAQIEQTNQNLKILHKQLGEVAINYHQAIHYGPSQQAFNELCDSIQLQEETANHIDAVKQALSNMETSGKEIEKSKISMKDLDNRFSDLMSAIGAVAMEADSANALPDSLRECMTPLEEFSDKLKELQTKADSKKNAFIVGSIAQNKVDKFKATLPTVFRSVGINLYNCPDFRQIPGARAMALMDEIDNVEEMKNNFNDIINTHQKTISDAQGSLKTMGAFGFENKTLKELTSAYESLSVDVALKYTEYGKVLADGMEIWLDSQAPEKLLTICKNIDTEDRNLYEEHVALDVLKLQLEVDAHANQAQNYKKQIENYNNQIEAINKELKEMEHKLDGEMEIITKLQRKQRTLQLDVVD